MPIQHWKNKLLSLCYGGYSLCLKWLKGSLLARLLTLFLIYYCARMLWSFSADTYISENAMLPGVAMSRLSSSDMIQNTFKLLTKIDRKDPNWSRNVQNVLLDDLMNSHVEAYAQNFSIRFPFNTTKELTGTNVYGIVRALRASSKEAIVLVAPFRSNSAAAMSLLLGVAKHCRTQIYWAKDIIVVFAQHDMLGMKAWLNAYYGLENQYIKVESLSARGGTIQAAIVLDMKGNRNFHNIDVDYAMLNGQLPNLDLVNAAVKIIESNGYRSSISYEHSTDGVQFMGNSQKANAIYGLIQQSLQGSQGLHSVFNGLNVEAITLRPCQTGSSGSQFTDFHAMARILEGLLRSLNNLLERFHQSYFIYWLLSSHQFISIAYLSPIFGISILIIFVMMMDAVFVSSTTMPLTACNRRPLTLVCLKMPEFFRNVKLRFREANRENWNVLLYVAAYHGFGYAGRSILYGFSDIDVSSSCFFFICTLLNGIAFCGPFIMTRLINAAIIFPVAQAFLSIATLDLIAVIVSLSLLNVGAGVILSILTIPVVFTVCIEANNRIMSLLKILIVVAVNPMVAYLLYNLIAVASYASPFETFYEALHATELGLMKAAIRDCLLDDWTLSYFIVGLTPSWMILWTLVASPRFNCLFNRLDLARLRK